MRDIQQILEQWGIWSRQRLEMDYSPVAAGFKGLLPDTRPNASCTDADALIVDSCVGRLKQKRPDEYELLTAYYIKGVPKRQVAKRLKCDEKIIRIKMQMAEGFVEGCLAIMAVEL